jgi:hypothetical protein
MTFETPNLIQASNSNEAKPSYFQEVSFLEKETPQILEALLKVTPDNLSNFKEIWGEKFESDESSGTNAISENNESFGKLIRSSVPLWKKENCEKKDVCIDGKYSPLQDDSKIQKNEEGYFAEMNLSVIPLDPSSPKVLGEIDSEAESQISENQSQNVDWVDLESGANANKTADQAKQVSLPESSTREAVVNRSMLKVLGLNENEAVGKIFNTSFIV